MNRYQVLLGVALCAALLAGDVLAAGADPRGDDRRSGDSAAPGRPPGPPLGWTTQLGVGAIVNPEFVGADEYQVIPIPYVEFRYLDERGTLLFANVPQGIGGYFYRRRDEDGRALNLGLAVAPGFNVRGDEIEGLDEVDPAIEARLLLEARWQRWSFDATVAQDIGSGHEGAYLDLAVARRGSIGRRGGFYGFGPVLRFGDDDYKSALYSVGVDESVASGLPAYDAEASIERLGIQGIVSLPLGQGPWRWTTIAQISRLLDESAESPVVVEENQFFFLTAVTRRF